MRIPRPGCKRHAAARGVRASRTRGITPLRTLAVTLVIACSPSDFDELTDPSAGHTTDAESACAQASAELAASGCPMPGPALDGRATDSETAPTAELDSSPGTGPDTPVEPDHDASSSESPSQDAAPVGQEADGSSQSTPDARVTLPPREDASVVPRDASTTDASLPTMPVVCGGQPLACMPGAGESGKQACTVCGAGEQTRTRKCSDDGCSWGAWSAWSVCAAAGPTCMPGKVETESQNCGACNSGKRTRTRTCRADGCGFGEWSAFGACGGQTAACTPGATAACSPADSCGQRVCTNSCTWSGCQPKKPSGCLRRRGDTQEEGSNYRCCGADRWQFCLPSCDWSDSCESCAGGAPDYCADC